MTGSDASCDRPHLLKAEHVTVVFGVRAQEIRLQMCYNFPMQPQAVRQSVACFLRLHLALFLPYEPAQPANFALDDVRFLRELHGERTEPEEHKQEDVKAGGWYGGGCESGRMVCLLFRIFGALVDNLNGSNCYNFTSAELSWLMTCAERPCV